MRKIVVLTVAVSLYAAAASGQTWLPQNWTAERRQQVYETAQGSKLIPYPWALALERPDDETLFFADNGRRFGFLPAGNGAVLPVGLVEDTNRNGTSHLGVTCAACHTRNVYYRGTTYRIDGGGADSDLYMFLDEMSRAVAATSRSASSAKFRRFADRVLGTQASAGARTTLFNQLKTFAAGYATFITNSTPATPWGRSRTDAFGMIFNRVTSIDLRIPSNSQKPNAPVSYPFLWDTSWLDKVQYDGGVPNQSIVERLGRNVGEVLGVFAEVKVHRRAPVLPVVVMQSTAKRFNMLALEDWWSELRAPKWTDATALPPLDAAKVARGRDVYNQTCLQCHALVTPGQRQKVTLVDLNRVATDPGMATVAGARKAATGILQGVRKNLVPFGPRFGAQALAGEVTGHVTISVILTPEISPSNPSPNGPGATTLTALGQSADAPEAMAADDTETVPPPTNNDRDDAERAHVRELLAEEGGQEEGAPAADAAENAGELETSLRAFALREAAEDITLEYRARPLDGIWATAPYLHNGSVPTLADLLKPAAQRPATFYVGDCEIDPVNVGCVSTQAPGAFLFDTSKKGNWNTGHEFGTALGDQDRAALLEYLKSL